MNTLEDAYDSENEIKRICDAISKCDKAFYEVPNLLDWCPESMKATYEPVLNELGYEYNSEWLMRILM